MTSQTAQSAISPTPLTAEAVVRALAAMTHPIVGRNPLDQELTQLLSGVRDLIHVDAVIVREIVGTELHLRGAVGVPSNNLWPTISAQGGIAGRMVAERSAVSVPDVRRDAATARFAREARNDPSAFIFSSYAGAPMIVGDELIGLLGVYAIAHVREFTDDELNQLQILANHIAAWMMNDRLYRELRESADRLREEIAERQRSEIERQALERQLRLAQKMDSLGRMAGGIAHDFNNLLTVLVAGVELLELEHGQSKNTENMKQAMATASGMTRQLLAFGQNQPLQPCAIELNAFLRDAQDMLRRLMPAEIAIEISCNASPCVVKVDASQLSQILLNLVVNARDAIGERGTIRIACRNVSDESQPDNELADYVELTVADDGCGMTSEVCQHIFEPFYSTKSGATGTGLGLATVYGIVNQLGGTISVESELGQGATFRVQLPRFDSEADSADAPETRQPPLACAAHTVLLCEDNESVRSVLIALLESANYRVIPAGTAQEALELALAHLDQIDLLMTDFDLPDLRGDALLDRVRSLREGLPAILVSGCIPDAGMSDIRHFNEVLLKPVTKSKLVEAIGHCLA
ncbi:MAG: response regulator [Phycisphaerales bacterium]|nr:response regulator [Phycisphaerales bacterium]